MIFLPNSPNHIHASTKQYIDDVHIANEYDQCFVNEPLFQYDIHLLNDWFQAPGHLIDLGCGTGRHLVAMAQLGHQVSGLDLSQKMLAIADHKLKRHQLGATLYQKDICHLDNIPKATFDYGICMFSTFGMIHKAANRAKFLTSVKEVLTPNGQLVIHVHNRHHGIWTQEGRNFLLSNYIKTKLGTAELGDKQMPNYRGIENMYLHLFSKAELINAIETAGFKILNLIELNQQRNGELQGQFIRKYRCNGYIIRMQTVPTVCHFAEQATR